MKVGVDYRMRLLSEVARLDIVCGDCGRRRTWGFRELKRMQGMGIHTLGDLAPKLSCSACPKSWRRAKNVAARPIWRADAPSIEARTAMSQTVERIISASLAEAVQ
ncbi:hypothetical protein [Chelatococcus reniformis]|uniref:Uncharacterized protein n=1 Tax=Chelatococcus reniformis TaxID=1494448 RepID=A0A916XFY4_9HYPH|nr:hypothetical protein [Chelatococcus reniformis]GGC70494.1 hypothetical protein GCM10010994_31280 [Chelatococcus reniformis]